MEKLVKKLELIISCNIEGGTDKCTEESYIVGEERTARLISEEAKKLALAFANKIVDCEIITDNPSEEEITMNLAYKMLQTLLKKHGETSFNEFINEYYE